MRRYARTVLGLRKIEWREVDPCPNDPGGKHKGLKTDPARCALCNRDTGWWLVTREPITREQQQVIATARMVEYEATPTCGQCGHTINLGVVAASYRSTVRRFVWQLQGRKRAKSVTAAWNAHVATHRS